MGGGWCRACLSSPGHDRGATKKEVASSWILCFQGSQVCSDGQQSPARLETDGSLEVYHSSMLKYTEKRLHFKYDTMRARTQLAILDHNASVGRAQATTKEGQPRYRYCYSKQSAQWVAKPMYTPSRHSVTTLWSVSWRGGRIQLWFIQSRCPVVNHPEEDFCKTLYLFLGLQRHFYFLATVKVQALLNMTNILHSIFLKG